MQTSFIMSYSAFWPCFARWPIHPIVFVFLSGGQAMHMAFSFLAGWLVKSLVVRYGGGRLYERLKPLMVGIIAGALASGLVRMIVGLSYYAVIGHGIGASGR